MSQCTKGDKPIITYVFGNNASKRYQSPIAPIDIVIGNKPIDASDNYNPEGFQIEFGSPQVQFGRVVVTVIDYRVFYINNGNIFDSNNGYYIALIGCGQSSFSKVVPSRGIPYDIGGIAVGYISSPQINVDNTVKCPAINPNKCNIKISSNGILLFQDQGDCPVNYNVQCGKCPQGSRECASPIYPGYCCIDCESVKNRIDAMTARIKGLNNG